jgi:hypothetical protein
MQHLSFHIHSRDRAGDRRRRLRVWLRERLSPICQHPWRAHLRRHHSTMRLLAGRWGRRDDELLRWLQRRRLGQFRRPTTTMRQPRLVTTRSSSISLYIPRLLPITLLLLLLLLSDGLGRLFPHQSRSLQRRRRTLHDAHAPSPRFTAAFRAA